MTIGYETLIGRLEQAGVLDTGERISPAAARRLACTARIIPAVLGVSPRSSTSAGATPTTTHPGHEAVAPTSTTADSSARDTTPSNTNTTPDSTHGPNLRST